MFVGFEKEMLTTMMLSLIAVLGIIMVITSHLTITLLVGVSIIVTDIFLGGSIFYWGMELNPLVSC